jgi:hypothetical protein
MTEFYKNIPDSITGKGKGVWENSGISTLTPGTIPCPVCGSTYQQMVLDLGDQPFANDFRNNTTQSLAFCPASLSSSSGAGFIVIFTCLTLQVARISSSDTCIYLELAPSPSLMSSDGSLRKQSMKAAILPPLALCWILLATVGRFLITSNSLDGRLMELILLRFLVQSPGAKAIRYTLDFGVNILEFKELPVGNELKATVAQNVFWPMFPIRWAF